MITEAIKKEFKLTGEETFPSTNIGGGKSGLTESFADHEIWERKCTISDRSEPRGSFNRSTITKEDFSLNSPQDLTQVYEFPKHQQILADPKMLDAFVTYVSLKLDEKDTTIYKLQNELKKLNKRKKFSSGGFRLPKNYYEKEIYSTE
jgi:hypothetical protein